ncbi:U3 small nucleolar RNA-associated protein 6-domain-containing protein [Ampelomyces quisqualis]|uniref:U3 small nucleolar RNA-associated protein 6-domain-containing protein n=1 Tax=Ampelomyces quisqualis TaxID=50730 RepID=A0A6A5QYC5_AMPQU|nr:U3 small nucleolar RNA-associated protein 6-domain-containing protein [Ampelomyces quisqualis]
MAGPSDKARFYLEQSATELNELERKNIFTRDEISSIAKKRSDFEHIINARGSHPADYLRYIEFEKNVDALRRKRIKRLGVRYKGAGQRTIYFLYNRATRKFSGDLTLWMQYIDFARKDKAYKKLNDIFTAVARLHPTKPEIWVHAAHYFMDTQADITNARSYMQRGLRFCKNSEYLWLEYAKLETIYVGKIAGRRKILGLDVDHSERPTEDQGDVDMIALPQVTAEDINPSLKQDDGVDEVALHNLASAPVLTGAIPLAVFDSAMKQFQSKARVAEKFFAMFAEFEQLACIPHILQHVLEYLQQTSPQSVEAAICEFRMQLCGRNPADPEFPPALADGLALISTATQQHPGHVAQLSEIAVRELLSLQRLSAETDAAVQTVLSKTLRKYTRALDEGSGDKVADLARSLRQEGRRRDSEALIRSSMKRFGANEELQRLYSALDS